MNSLHGSAIAAGRIAFSLAAMLLATTTLAETVVPAFPPDTEVRVATTVPLSSATAKLGEKIALTVVDDVMIDALVAIPKGSPGVGTVIF